MIDIEQYTGKRVHMIGIGGSSMSGLVDFLLTRGIRVTGSDRDNSHHVEALVAKGVPVTIPPQTRVLLTLTVKDPRK